MKLSVLCTEYTENIIILLSNVDVIKKNKWKGIKALFSLRCLIPWHWDAVLVLTWNGCLELQHLTAAWSCNTSAQLVWKR